MHDPHPVLLFNHARALEEAQRLPSALAAYRQLERHADIPRVVEAAAKRRQIVEETLRAQGSNPATITEADYRIPVDVQIQTGVEHATVYVDGRHIGSGARVHTRIPGGAHHVYIDAHGYYPFEKTVHISDSGETLHVTLEVRSSLSSYVAPPPGLLSIIGPTSGMTIYIDGVQHTRMTPAKELILPAGEYDVVVRHPLYDDFQARVLVRAGEEYPLIATNRYAGIEPIRRLSRRQPVGNGTIVAGSVLFGAAAFTGTMAAVQSRAYNGNPASDNRAALRTSARHYATSTDALLVSGAVILGAGLAMRLLPQKAKEEELHYHDRLLELSPGVSGAPLGLTLRVRH